MTPQKLRSHTFIIAMRFCAALGALAFLSFAVFADERPGAPASSVAPVTKGQRVFTCAHSFHGFVYRMLEGMAKSAGIADHQSVGMSSIGGSRVIQHWDVADDKFGTKAALTE